MCNKSPCRKGNSHLRKLLNGFYYEKIRRYNNSSSYVTARWPPQQILSLNFYRTDWLADWLSDWPTFHKELCVVPPPLSQCRSHAKVLKTKVNVIFLKITIQVTEFCEEIVCNPFVSFYIECLLCQCWKSTTTCQCPHQDHLCHWISCRGRQTGIYAIRKCSTMETKANCSQRRGR